MKNAPAWPTEIAATTSHYLEAETLVRRPLLKTSSNSQTLSVVTTTNTLQKHVCRMSNSRGTGFTTPFAAEPNTHLHFTEKKGRVRVTVRLKRHDSYLNVHNCIQITVSARRCRLSRLKKWHSLLFTPNTPFQLGQFASVAHFIQWISATIMNSVHGVAA